MGVSTDAMLVFGIACGDEEEVPGFMLGFDDFDEYLNSISGLPEYGCDGHDFDAQRKFRDSVPADMTLHCSYDYLMYILAVRGTEICACRGNPKEITSLDVPAEKVEAFKAWASERGIVGEPKWLLCSMWG
jgi:hypothetical protein